MPLRVSGAAKESLWLVRFKICAPFHSLRASGRRLRRHSDAPHEAIHHRAENYKAIGRAERRFDRTLRMRHQAEHVAFAIADSGDVREEPFGFPAASFRPSGVVYRKMIRFSRSRSSSVAASQK